MSYNSVVKSNDANAIEKLTEFPNAYNNFANEISLPLHTCLTDEQVGYVIDNYTEVLKEYL